VNHITERSRPPGYHPHGEWDSGTCRASEGDMARITLRFGTGNDSFNVGNSSDDWVINDLDGDGISAGNNTYITGSGHDQVTTGSGSDSINTGGGNDDVRSGGGVDSVFGGSGHDELWGGNGNDWLYGQDDDDQVHGGEDHDHVYGGNGDDDVYGEGGNDVVSGGAGDDYLYGGGNNDTLYGGTGDNWISGGTGIDTLSMNEDFSAAMPQYSYAVATVDLMDNSAYVVGHLDRFVHVWNSLEDIENIVGTNEIGSGVDNLIEDILRGDNNANSISGLRGDDLLEGRGGNDTLSGGEGNDIVIGGGGADTLWGGAHADTFLFGAGDSAVANPDSIRDFVHGTDRIDLSAIDANTLGRMTGNQAFSSIVDEFTGAAAELRLIHLDYGITTNSSWSVAGDVNGDAVADFQIIVWDVPTLAIGDFIL
jgi:Ca2+-binding RTX toxin-like protein